MATETIENVDQGEVAKFNEMASRWWDPDGDFRPLHQINPLRLDWIRQKADIRGMQIVDVGCGGGILTESMSVAGATVKGIDLAERFLGEVDAFDCGTGNRHRFGQDAAAAANVDDVLAAKIGLLPDPVQP